MPYFDCKAPRIISSAQQTYYPTPNIHPDRIMPEHDFVCVLEGEWEICEEDLVYLLRPGDVLILFAGRHHFGRIVNKRGTRILYAHSSVSKKDTFENAAEHSTNGIELPSLIHCAKSSGAIRSFHELVDVFWKKSPNRDIRLAAQFELFLCELATAVSSGQSPFHGLSEKITTMLHSDPRGEITIDGLADELGVSKRRLRYIFEREIGMPPYRYHLNLRLDMAMKTIQNEPERTFREVADIFGFFDEFHFSHAFKRRFGMPPNQVARTSFSAVQF